MLKGIAVAVAVRRERALGCTLLGAYQLGRGLGHAPPQHHQTLVATFAILCVSFTLRRFSRRT